MTATLFRIPAQIAEAYNSDPGKFAQPELYPRVALTTVDPALAVVRENTAGRIILIRMEGGLYCAVPHADVITDVVSYVDTGLRSMYDCPIDDNDAFPKRFRLVTPAVFRRDGARYVLTTAGRLEVER